MFAQMKTGCSLTPEGDLGAVHTINHGIAAGSGLSASDALSGQEAEFHQTPGDILRKIETIEHAFFAGAEVTQAALSSPRGLPDTELHHLQYRTGWADCQRQNETDVVLYRDCNVNVSCRRHLRA